MITAKSMIGRPTYHAPNYVNVWFARDSCSNLRFKELKIPDVETKKSRETNVTCNGKAPSLPKTLNMAEQSSRSISNGEGICRSKVSPLLDPTKDADAIKVDLNCYLGQNGKSRKLSVPKSLSQRKKCKKHEKWTLTDESSLYLRDGKKFRSKTVEDALEVIENRKKTIKAKLLVGKEHLLTQEEEQDIHTRADLYAITTVPDTKYCILSSEGPVPNSFVRYEEFHEEPYQPVRKKRRRNYGNANCYVTHHNDDDIFDNTKMLPIGTRLLKPPTKLVELVAQAISGSPDGLLQVQQIYTFLQNKFPFFRYMDRVAINSWRSSIRHALYQKWFRKIRFDSSFISSKGCYWAINNQSNPKEWSLPDNGYDRDSERNYCMEDLQYLNDEQETQEIAAIAKKLLSADECTDDDLRCDQDEASHDVQEHIPSPMRAQDPILSTCTAAWNNEDISISSNESGHGTMTPVNSPSYPSVLHLTQESQDCDIRADFILGTPLNSPTNSCSDFRPFSEYPTTKSKTCEKLSKTDISPIVHWTPDWEEYGSYIISPQNLATLKYVQSLPGEKETESNNNISLHEDSTDIDPRGNKTDCTHLERSPVLDYSCGSDTESCEFEIIAEFSKSDLELTTDLGLCS